MFEPLTRVTLCDMVVQKILSKIKSGELKAGDKLPSERELSKNFQVSRVSVREGIKVLSALGFVDVKVGTGAIVKKIDVMAAIEPLVNSLYLESFALIQIVEARKVIEVSLAGLAAERATEEDMLILEKSLEDMKNNYLNEEVFRDSDASFHVAIAEIAQNEILYKIIFTIRDLLKATSSKTYQIPGAWGKALKYHHRIYEAIKERNSVEAESAMLEHLEDVGNGLLLFCNKPNL